MLYDAKGDEILDEEFTFENIPLSNFDPPTPKPDWFDAEVNKIGGFVDNVTKTTPRYRVMWGMDPKNTQFAMGKMRMKYITVCDIIETTLGYNIVNAHDPTKHRFVDAKLAHAMYQDPVTKLMTKNVSPGELLVPVTKEEEIEIGLPLWIVEQWVPSIALGSKREWENERFLSNPDDALHYIDVLGPYPENGVYIHWFDLIDFNDEGQEIYRELDEGAIEVIRANHVANIARRKAEKYRDPIKDKNKKSDWVDEQWAKMDEELSRDILDVKANRKFNFTPRG